MADLQITCINKEDRDDPYERIRRVGGGQTLLGSWRKSQQEVIDDIKNGRNTFYVQSGGLLLARAEVIVRTSRYGNEYITTAPDGESQNNLLSLPECRG